MCFLKHTSCGHIIMIFKLYIFEKKTNFVLKGGATFLQDPLCGTYMGS